MLLHHCDRGGWGADPRLSGCGGTPASSHFPFPGVAMSSAPDTRLARWLDSLSCLLLRARGWRACLLRELLSDALSSLCPGLWARG